MNQIDMQQYYRDSVVLCRKVVSDAVTGYVEGLALLHAAINGKGCKKKDIAKLQDTVTAIYSEIPTIGKHLAHTLQLWQEHGGTLRELCKMCGVDYKRFSHIPTTSPLVDIIREYQIDFYMVGRRTVTWKDDAPLTLGILAIDYQREIKSGL